MAAHSKCIENYLCNLSVAAWRSLHVRLTQVAEQWQQVLEVTEPQHGQSEGHLCREERHGEVLNKLCSQALLQLSHVGRHVIRQENEHADIILHLDLSDLQERKLAEVSNTGGAGWFSLSPDVLHKYGMSHIITGGL